MRLKDAIAIPYDDVVTAAVATGADCETEKGVETCEGDCDDEESEEGVDVAERWSSFTSSEILK